MSYIDILQMAVPIKSHVIVGDIIAIGIAPKQTVLRMFYQENPKIYDPT